MDYAWIDDGVVTNLIWLSPGNASDFPNAVPLGGRPVAIGDTYENGVFYANGKRVLTLAEQALMEAHAETEAMKEALETLGVSANE